MSSDRKAAFYARTMHTPDWPERAELRSALRETSKQLIALHRQLIAAAKEDFAFATGSAPPAPAEMLRLLTDDPFFAWLKPMTGLIVEIDEMARTDFEPAAAWAIGQRLSAMFDGTQGDFAQHYVPILQREVEVTIAHAGLRGAMGKLRK
jgi:hypothetical protein